MTLQVKENSEELYSIKVSYYERLKKISNNSKITLKFEKTIKETEDRFNKRFDKLKAEAIISADIFLSFFWSGHRGSKAYSLWDGVVPKPEHRL